MKKLNQFMINLNKKIVLTVAKLFSMSDQHQYQCAGAVLKDARVHSLLEEFTLRWGCLPAFPGTEKFNQRHAFIQDRLVPLMANLCETWYQNRSPEAFSAAATMDLCNRMRNKIDDELEAYGKGAFYLKQGIN